jgi:hypothetical protein
MKAQNVLGFSDIISDSWRYEKGFYNTVIRDNFLYVVSSFSDIVAILHNKKWGVRFIYNLSEIVHIHEISSLEVKPTDRSQGLAFPPVNIGEISVVYAKDSAAADDAITFYTNTEGKKHIFAIWLIKDRRLLVPRSSKSSFDSISNHIIYLISLYGDFFSSDTAKKERAIELEKIESDIKNNVIFSIGGDPEFELINSVAAQSNKVPDILEAKHIEITSQNPTAVVGADGTGWQVELRPEAVMFKISDNSEEIAEEFVSKSSSALSRYASTYTPTISAYGQKYALGHHIHIGSLYKISADLRLVNVLDHVIGIPLKTLNSPTRVESRFGKLGDVEEKDYGFEYRTASAIWAHPLLTKLVFTIVVKLIQAIADNSYIYAENEESEVILEKLGFDKEFRDNYTQAISKYSKPAYRIDTLGNWAVRRTYPIVSWKFSYNTRKILLSARETLAPVFLVSKDNKVTIVSSDDKLDLIAAIKSIGTKYNLLVAYIKDIEHRTDISIRLSQDVDDMASAESTVGSHGSSTTWGSDAEIYHNVSNRESSSDAGGFYDPIIGLTQFILPNKMPDSFYSEVVDACNTMGL